MTIPNDWNDLTLSTIVPVFNEAESLEASIERLHSVPLRLEIVVVDDGSTDGSGEILDRLLGAGRVHKAIHQPRNLGKGAAVRAGIEAATGHVIVVQDARV